MYNIPIPLFFLNEQISLNKFFIYRVIIIYPLSIFVADCGLVAHINCLSSDMSHCVPIPEEILANLRDRVNFKTSE